MPRQCIMENGLGHASGPVLTKHPIRYINCHDLNYNSTESGLIGSRCGLNPGPLDLELPALSSELLCFEFFEHIKCLTFFGSRKDSLIRYNCIVILRRGNLRGVSNRKSGLSFTFCDLKSKSANIAKPSLNLDLISHMNVSPSFSPIRFKHKYDPFNQN